MKFFATTVLLILLLISFGCMKQFSIPDNLDDEKNQTAFGAGDTTFLQLNPVWDSDYGILDPQVDYNVDVTDGVLAIFTKN